MDVVSGTGHKAPPFAKAGGLTGTERFRRREPREGSDKIMPEIDQAVSKEKKICMGKIFCCER
jgi:hypothetical protein